MLVCLVLALSGCKNYVQVFETSPMPGTRMPFGDRNVQLDYDFWQHRGLMRVTVTNISDQVIYPNWEKTGYLRGTAMGDYKLVDDLPAVLHPGESYLLEEYALWTTGLIPEMEEQSAQTLTPTTTPREVFVKDYVPSFSPRQFGHVFSYCLYEDCEDLISHEHQFYISRVKQLREKDYAYFIALVDAGLSPPIDLVYTDQFYVYKHRPGERGDRFLDGLTVALDILSILMDIAAVASDVRNVATGNDGNDSWHRPSSASPRYNQGRSRTVSD